MSAGYVFGKNEIDSVLAQPASTRYSYFVKRVADWGEVWTLSDSNGLVVFESTEGIKSAALWPFKEFAERCAVDAWKETQAEMMDLGNFLDEFLVDMQEGGYKIAVFPNASNGSLVVDPMTLRRDIEDERERFE